ncbi:MAG: tRNA pseudouridine(55) synthase TruB [Patescibacteria group bacterium]|jgi:tRNA pseudouridine55 synthase|nr:tRNA pseudouridine(55) synthase TruB [Patescibacteria group bacterium]MDD5172708.1 tRNA pseudouridine(55) synthase TruB [Patescibacteria group bacterium]
MNIKPGIFAFYKPKKISSFKFLEKIKKNSSIKKIGHAGTLDPLACGVLVVGLGGENCKKLNEIVKKEKEYIAIIKLGMNSVTDDEEGEKTKISLSQKPDLEKIKNTLNKFKGEIKQKPPIFSAIKIKGLPAYKLARQGKKVKIRARTVELKDFKILKYHWPYLKIKIITGSGFYVRSLAKDLGRKLKTGAYLKDLERIRVGDFSKNKCLKI